MRFLYSVGEIFLRERRRVTLGEVMDVIYCGRERVLVLGDRGIRRLGRHTPLYMLFPSSKETPHIKKKTQRQKRLPGNKTIVCLRNNGRKEDEWLVFNVFC